MMTYRKKAVAKSELKDLHGKADHQKFSKLIKMHNGIFTCRLFFLRESVCANE